MSTALWPLQRAVYTALTGDTTLMSLVTGVFDEVPENQAAPYVTLGPVTEQTDDAHNQRGLAATVQLDVWSRYRGWREAAGILDALDTVLDRRPLAVDGWRDVSVAHQQHTELRDPDPEIRHITATYRVWLTKA
ncbi:DUF3168 domain-containing protein [Streptomyces sp. B1866]|uniref:DUF3168 domain-containing protein n=1 Tax=Streptomyces sp. B1866 TaxID=3075431 RepID=UPI00288CA3ED|nr:DUF3168 domain-containing protein [Streptomyces sp. B1866]MDT3395434.1 DUF3168 domain-containing protein [Streptomyces sp. B1866]